MTIIVSAATSASSLGIVCSATAIAALAGTATGSLLGLISQVGGTAMNAGRIAAAVGSSTSAGAIIGAALSKTVTGAIAGSSAGLVSSGLSAATAAMLSGPLGWIVVGVASTGESTITYDCWKAVLHDSSPEPSNGMLLRDIVRDPRIQHVTATAASGSLPDIVLHNVWDEEFRIEYIQLSPDQIAAHAVPSE